MRVLVTGGAGFIGRWVVSRLLQERAHTPLTVSVLDNLSNSSSENIAEFEGEKESFTFIEGDIRNRKLLRSLCKPGFDLLIHLAASINVHESLQNPEETFENDVVGTFNLLEEARKANTRFVYMSTCMVYERAEDRAISEDWPLAPASPYAGSKLAGENLVESYHRGYGLPVVILRPFNTYGPFQKSNQEGGVVAIFIEKTLKGEDIPIGARIRAVADAYDAMTSSRPYRPPLPPEEARVRLRESSGSQFDPEIVEQLFAVVDLVSS
jgi:nucleoside-diphosphate-sugar epimerase